MTDEESVTTASRKSLIEDRMKWLQQENKRTYDGPRQDKVDGVQKGLAADRMKWLNNVANEENDKNNEETEGEAPERQSYGGSLISDRMKWLDEQNNKEYDGPRQDKVEGIQEGLAVDRSKWLDNNAFSKGEEKKTEETALKEGEKATRSSLIADRTSWLDEQGKKKEFDGPRQDKVEGIQKGLAAEKAKWLQSGAKNENDSPTKKDNEIVSTPSYGGSLIADRMSWLDEQSKKKEFDGPRQEKVEGIQKGVAAEKAKWLQSGTKSENDSPTKVEKEETVASSYGGSLIADRMSWLDEQVKKKDFDGPRQDKIEGVQKGLAAEKAKWLQSGAKSENDSPKKKEHDTIVSQSYGGSLIADRMSWLDEQGKKKDFDGPRQDNAQGVQKGLAAEKTKWLESGAKNENEAGTKQERPDLAASQSYGGSLVADRMSWLDEQNKKKEFDGPRQDNVEGVQKGLAAEKAKWLQSGAKNEREDDDKNEKRPGLAATSQSYDGSLIADRMSWLDEQSKQKEFGGPRQDNVEGIQQGLASDRSKWLESVTKRVKYPPTNEKTTSSDQKEKGEGTTLDEEKEQGNVTSDSSKSSEELVEDGGKEHVSNIQESEEKDEAQVEQPKPDKRLLEGIAEESRSQDEEQEGKLNELDKDESKLKVEDTTDKRTTESMRVSKGSDEDKGEVSADEEDKEQDLGNKCDKPMENENNSGNKRRSLIEDRKKWLSEQSKKEFDGPRQDTGEGIIVSNNEDGSSLIESRRKWLDEQSKKEYDGPKQDNLEGVELYNAEEKKKWLKSVADDFVEHGNRFNDLELKKQQTKLEDRTEVDTETTGPYKDDIERDVESPSKEPPCLQACVIL